MTEEEFTRRIMAMRNRLYHVGRAMLWNDEDAADAVQEAMLAAWKQRRALRDEDKFEAWFMRVFINRCRDMRRGQIRRREAREDAVRRYEEAAPEPGDASAALDALPDRLRLPAVLFYVEGYSQKEVARLLGLEPEQVNTRLRQARGRLRRALAEGGDRDE
ncbi:MAG: sigma-70 family RNA polymerase sigma factor [Clostridia bacterium]|nr:sigma-70 family RNA polymerase sigma factor [Clostridia bacterium]